MSKRLFLPLLALLVMSACSTPVTTPPAPTSTAMGTTEIMSVDANGSTAVDQATLGTALNQIPVGTLTTAEGDGLTYMREEEKLAGDVYLALFAKWNLPIFQNIAASEATHTAAIKTLLDRYGLHDPAANQAVGAFTNTTLQGLYDQLVAQGSQSLADALRVGATIEDLDIVDLDQRSAQTDTADIQLVYANLKKGSRNHLRSFTTLLKDQTGTSYQPQYLSQAAYDAIITTPRESGR